MNDKRILQLVVLILIIAPGVHYFMTASALEQTDTQNFREGAQILGGAILLYLVRKK